MVLRQSYKQSLAIFLLSLVGMICMLGWIVWWAMKLEHEQSMGREFLVPFPRGHAFVATIMLILTAILSVSSIYSVKRMYACMDQLFVVVNAKVKKGIIVDGGDAYENVPLPKETKKTQ